MRSLSTGSLSLALCVVGGLANAQSTSDNLEGWGVLKFGMRLDQVLMLPGFRWGPHRPTGPLASQSKVNVEGLDWESVIAFFDPVSSKLTRVTASGALARRGSSSCEQKFQEYLANFEIKYGAFHPPVQPGNPDASLQSRALPGKQSLYGIQKWNPDSETGRLSARMLGPDSTDLSAMREFGVHRVRVRMLLNSQTTEGFLCGVRVYIS